MRLRHLAPLALLGWSCRDPVNPAGTDNSIRQLPTELRFEAFANGQLPDGRDIQCSIETHIVITSDVSVAGNATIRTGTGGGDATRNKELSDGNTVAFWATTGFQDLQIAYIGTDSIEIRSPGSADIAERFWKEFARFAGSRRNLDPAQGVYAEGDWTCHPMDTPESSGEYYDAEGSVPGRWTLYRANNPL